MCVIKTDSKVE